MVFEHGFRKRVGRYYLGKTLGEGSYAKVKYGQHVETGLPVAVKVLDKSQLIRKEMALQMQREIAIMRQLSHPSIVNLIEVMSSKDKVYIVMELVTGGELFDKVVAEGRLKDDHARKIFIQLLNGLEYCHDQGVYHRDLKPENVLLTTTGDAKLSDFGLGALQVHSRPDGLFQTTCGTPNYVAPEVLRRKGYEGGPADVWSLGVVLYIMLVGCLPFDEPNMGSLFRKITAAVYATPPWLTDAQRAILRRILVPDPVHRPTLSDLRADPWVARGAIVRRSMGLVQPLPPRAGPAPTPSSTCQAVEHRPEAQGRSDEGTTVADPASGLAKGVTVGEEVTAATDVTVTVRAAGDSGGGGGGGGSLYSRQQQQASNQPGQQGGHQPDADEHVIGERVEQEHMTAREQMVLARRSMLRRAGSHKRLNAFELMNEALDISAMFEPLDDEVVSRPTRFTTHCAPADVHAALERAAAVRGGKAEHRSSSVLRLHMVDKMGSPLVVDAAVRVVLPGTYLVELARYKGRAAEFRALYRWLVSDALAGLIARRQSMDFSPRALRTTMSHSMAPEGMSPHVGPDEGLGLACRQSATYPPASTSPLADAANAAGDAPIARQAVEPAPGDAPAPHAWQAGESGSGAAATARARLASLSIGTTCSDSTYCPSPASHDAPTHGILGTRWGLPASQAVKGGLPKAPSSTAPSTDASSNSATSTSTEAGSGVRTLQA